MIFDTAASLWILTIPVLFIIGHILYRTVSKRHLTALFLFFRIAIPLLFLWINFLLPGNWFTEAIILIFLGVNVGIYLLYILPSLRSLFRGRGYRNGAGGKGVH